MWSFDIHSIFHVKEACRSFIYSSSISIHTLIEILLLMVFLTSSYISKFQIQVTNLAPLSISDYWKIENEYNAFRKIDQKAIKGWMKYDKMHHIAHMCGLLKSTIKLLLNPSQNMAKLTLEIWTPKYPLHKLFYFNEVNLTNGTTSFSGDC